MEEYLSEWGRLSEKHLNPDFPSSHEISVVDEKCFCMDEGYYVVVNYTRRPMIGTGFEELILYLSRGPDDPIRYAHLTDSWLNTHVTIGDMIHIPVDIEWVIGDDDQGMYHQCFCCLMDENTHGPVVYPHMLMRISAIASFRDCQRALFFRETHIYREPTFRSIYGIIATNLVQKCITEEMSHGSFCAKEMAEALNNEYTLELCNITQEGDYALKSIHELRAQVSKLANLLDEPHNVEMTVPKSDTLVKATKCFPGFGQRKCISDETIWSFSTGFIGRPSCVIEVRDENSVNFVPVEVIATLSMSDPLRNSWRIGHLLSLTATLNLLAENYGRDQTTAAFIWYLGSNQKFWMKPRLAEENHTRLLRNAVITSIVNDHLPPMDKRECANCLSRSTCVLYERMFDARDFVPESQLDLALPRTMTDFTTNPARTFFNKYRRMNFDSALYAMNAHSRITSMRIEERERMGYAISNMEVIAIDDIPDVGRQSLKRQVTFRNDKPGKLYHCRFTRHDMVFVTKDGNAPVIAFGNVSTFTDETLTLVGHEECFRIGEKYVLDFCKSDHWYKSNNAVLSNLLMNPLYASLSSYLIGERKPLFSTSEPDFDRSGLNLRQQEAVSLALRAANYLLINAPHGTGRIATCLRIVYTKAKNGHTVLLSPFFYSSLNKLCAGLELMSLSYVVCGRLDKINEAFHHRSEVTLFSACKTADEVDSLMKDIRVFVVPSCAKQFNVVCNRLFDTVILFEASCLPLLHAVPSLCAGSPFILFGDAVMDASIDSVFSHLARISPQSVVNLWEMYNCESAIVSASRLVWGSELRCSSSHASVSLEPLRVLDKSIREFFMNVISMDRPLVFVKVDNYLASVFVSIVAGLVFESVNLISRRELLPQLGSSLFAFRTAGDAMFTKFRQFMSAAAGRVKFYNAGAVLSKRKDVIVAVASHCDSSVLQVSLGMTRRKLILIGKLEDVCESPLWATLLNQMPSDWKFEFPSSLFSMEVTPFKPIQDIEDLCVP